MVTVLGRRKVDSVAGEYGVTVEEEEQQGRLRQHVQGQSSVWVWCVGVVIAGRSGDSVLQMQNYNF